MAVSTEQFVSGNVPEWVIIKGVIYLGHEKAPFTPSGCGVRGAISYRPADDRLRCHECGRWCESLASHIRGGHRDLSVRSYKRKHCLSAGASLINRRIQASLSAKARELADSVTSPAGAPISLIAQRMGDSPRATRKMSEAALSPDRKGAAYEDRNLRGACHAQLIDRIGKIVRELGYTPSSTEFASRGIHLSTVLDSFGVKSIPDLMDKLGHGPCQGHWQRESDQGLLDTLRDFYVSRKRLPLSREFGKSGLPSTSTFIKRFESVRRACEMAGLGLVVRGRGSVVIPDDLIFARLRAFCDSHGRVPMIREFQTDGLPFSATLLRNRFGSVLLALKSSGVDPMPMLAPQQHGGWRGPSNQTAEFIKKSFSRFCEERNRPPRSDEILAGALGCSASTICRYYGTAKVEKLMPRLFAAESSMVA